MEEVRMMKDDVRSGMNREMDPLAKLELVDAIQRLGLEYHFRPEIKHVLGLIHGDSDANRLRRQCDHDLHATALRFRLLRQHGYYEMPEDVFQIFMHANGKFISSLGDDVKGLLSLYEASFGGFEGELVMDEARSFSIVHLKSHTGAISSPALARKVEHALEMAIHWRPNRLEAIRFMEMYEDEPGMNPTLLKLAKLDYNTVQSFYREEFNQLTRWWRELGFSSMTFSRDDLIEYYLWNIIMMFEPQYKDFREMTTKMTCMVTLMDDIYDKLGPLEELELLTDLIDRWDTAKADELPPVMKTCFLALCSIINEVGNRVLIKRGFDVSSYLQKAWADQCKAYLLEAKWCNRGFKPSVKDYLSNAMRSMGGLMVLLCCFFITTDDLTEGNVKYISGIPNIMQCSTLIFRLNNDLVPSSGELAEGDQLNAVECFMTETRSSEKEAREHTKDLLHETWRAMNRYAFDDKDRLPGPFVRTCMNLARASHWIYRYGDGHEVRSREAKEHLMSVLIQPAPE